MAPRREKYALDAPFSPLKGAILPCLVGSILPAHDRRDDEAGKGRVKGIPGLPRFRKLCHSAHARRDEPYDVPRSHGHPGGEPLAR